MHPTLLLPHTPLYHRTTLKHTHTHTQNHTYIKGDPRWICALDTSVVTQQMIGSFIVYFLLLLGSNIGSYVEKLLSPAIQLYHYLPQEAELFLCLCYKFCKLSTSKERVKKIPIFVIFDMLLFFLLSFLVQFYSKQMFLRESMY